jgi:hypothetical protein
MRGSSEQCNKVSHQRSGEPGKKNFQSRNKITTKFYGTFNTECTHYTANKNKKHIYLVGFDVRQTVDLIRVQLYLSGLHLDSASCHK